MGGPGSGRRVHPAKSVRGLNNGGPPLTTSQLLIRGTAVARSRALVRREKDGDDPFAGMLNPKLLRRANSQHVDPEKKAFLHAYLRNYCVATAAAAEVGLLPDKVSSWKERDDYFREAMDECLAIFHDAQQSYLRSRGMNPRETNPTWLFYDLNHTHPVYRDARGVIPPISITITDSTFANKAIVVQPAVAIPETVEADAVEVASA